MENPFATFALAACSQGRERTAAAVADHGVRQHSENAALQLAAQNILLLLVLLGQRL